MKGKASCILQTVPPEARIFKRCKLTFIGDTGHAILATVNDENPRELLFLECARMNVLSDELVELEGFTRTNVDAGPYTRCSVVFWPADFKKKEVA